MKRFPRFFIGTVVAFAACTKAPVPERLVWDPDDPKRPASALPAAPIKFDVGAPAPTHADEANAPAVTQLCQAICATGLDSTLADDAEAAASQEACRHGCDAPTQRPRTGASCRDHAAAARSNVERLAMQRRAPRAWAAIADPALHCGYTDAFIEALAGAATKNLSTRDRALARALDADPHLEILCRGGADTLDRIRRDALPWMTAAEECGLDLVAARRVSVFELSVEVMLAYSAVRLRWDALGITSAGHTVLLNILLLSSGLERENAR